MNWFIVWIMEMYNFPYEFSKTILNFMNFVLSFFMFHIEYDSNFYIHYSRQSM